MNSVSIDFSSVRPLNGSKAEGFEELCSQLARIDSPKDARFVRKGTPDAGVECYIIFPNGDEWGWQAKYFDTLGESQWAQLDSSVRTALDKHPRLKKYFICIPVNLADPRLTGKKSAQQRWNEHVSKWRVWARARNIGLEFVWQGHHELMLALLRTSSAGLLRYWFDVAVFDERWFESRLDEALKTAGPRYTPEINVTLPVAEEFEAFGRTTLFLDRIKSLAKGLRVKGKRLDYSKRGVPEPAIEATISGIGQQLQGTLDSLGALSPQPIEEIPLPQIADELSTAYDSTKQLEEMLREMEYARKAEQPKEENSRTDPSLRDCINAVYSLSAELYQARETLTHASDLANSCVMILTGSAGTGKTHLLCDVAKQRLMSSRPTVLLMGQRFLSLEAPWTQALHQLDLAALSSEEFVGALAASAQAANCRALVLIDAINEGEGRTIWPPHIGAFLRQIQKSPWIGVVLSVRSSYEEIVLPEEIRSNAITIVHHGFAECEYDAVRTLFVYYGIELPSTPLLAPEFQNPLFLKTLCTGLQETGQHRLPRGFQGISAVFDLYFGAMNSRLASALDFNPKDPLVREALRVLANTMVQAGKRWLTRNEVESVVNALLPGTGFSKSLYRALVDEGALIEDVARASESAVEDIVLVAYERLADHLIASALLMSHLDTANPAIGFQPGGALAFLWDERQYVPSGLIEALCIQVPELTGEELIDLAPQILQRWDIGIAFRQSLVWRAPNAFSEGTRAAFNRLIRNDSDLAESLDVLLTVATLPEHPLNGHFLNRMLRRYKMPDRDSFWSVYLHRAFGQHKAVDRLVDWSFAVKPGTEIDEEAVELCATALVWMLTTSNRHLRDRATQAAVNLLTGRLDAMSRLVKAFEDVDDPFVRERLYAIAYGVAMRSSDVPKIGVLAHQVYASVFKNGRPIPQLLLRDYARGVIERALSLGTCADVVVEKIRPPYTSNWPKIPTEEEIKPLLPDWSRGSHDSGDVTWARNRIGDSVMQDDFGRYVIGTNSGFTDWLALRLKQKRWTSPEILLSSLVATFSEQERLAWDKVKLAEAEVSAASFSRMLAGFRHEAEAERSKVGDDESNDDLTLTSAKRELEASCLALEGVLTKKNNRLLRSILKKKEINAGRPPRFDLRLIQRYVLWRVFDLGWTTDRFGKFDRFQAGHFGREGSKAERLGKKYQWIAYHEIMALVADHFQYQEEFQRELADQSYEGPWQDFFRDIDPSCTLRSTPGGTSWDGHSPSWWGTFEYNNWGSPEDPEGWAAQYNDLPPVQELIQVVRPTDKSKWLNLDGHFSWRMQPPADRESIDVEHREVWYSFEGYLIKVDEAVAFLTWAEGVDFWGRWMPDAPDNTRVFLGEHAWSPASRYFQQPYYGDEGWTRPGNGCPATILPAAFAYIRGSSGFDCSVDEGYTLRLPASALMTHLRLRWSGNGADYLDTKGELAAFDPTVHEKGPSALLIREVSLHTVLKREGLTLCWSVLGEKRMMDPGFSPRRHASLRLSGAFLLTSTGLSGFVKYMPGHPSSTSPAPDPIAIIRNSSS